jgi:hypothetical protein
VEASGWGRWLASDVEAVGREEMVWIDVDEGWVN